MAANVSFVESENSNFDPEAELEFAENEAKVTDDSLALQLARTPDRPETFRFV